MDLRLAMTKAMTGEQITEYLGPEIKVIPYSKVAEYETLDDLLGPARAVVILFEMRKGNGHWTCIFRHKNRVSVFDSLGIFPCDEVDFANPLFLIKSGQEKSHLRELLIECPWNLEWSQYRLQRSSPEISTCGRHVICRLQFPEKNAAQYAKMLRVKGKTPDEIVTLAIWPDAL